jgi:SAM-dependent methyltransferase
MKKILLYINFFVYHALNWNPWLAFFILFNTIKGEKKYGINTFVPSELKKYTIATGDISKASPYEALNYYILQKLLANFRKLYPEEKSIVDVGCGKGRVLAVAAYFGFTKITGVDFAKELCEKAEKNMRQIKPNFPDLQYKIIWDNILNYSLDVNDRVFFLFNPFEKEIMEPFLDKIEQSVKQSPRTIYFLYANPQQLNSLLDRNYEVIYRIKKIKFLEGIIALKHN